MSSKENRCEVLKAEPLVSVIIPTRNRSSLLSRALNSVLNQSYDNLEVIIIDDASEDDTTKEVDKYRPKFKRLKYIRNNKQCGGAAARNIGIRNATGKYIAFLDDDDEWLPEKTLKQLTILESSPNIGAVSCWYNRIYNNKIQKVRLIAEVSFEFLLWENFMGSFSLCVVRSELAKTVRFDPFLSSSQDWQFWLELSMVTRIHIAEDFLVNYHDHSGERISRSYNSKYLGLRRLYFTYRDYMREDCRVYRLTYLIIYRIFNSQIIDNKFLCRIIQTPKMLSLLKDKTSRFVLRKLLLLRITKILHLDVYDPAWVTYRFIKNSYCVN